MITRVAGVRVGHVTDLEGATGCTVVLPPPGTVGSGEVRGGAPGTRETDLLRPGMLVDEVHAVLLTGGSAFGLAAADGVMRWLAERGVGFDTGVARVPIVPSAVLFDLGVGSSRAHPGPDDGYAACDAASGGEVEEGSVGAGTGATVAKLHGSHRAVKGGIGTAAEADGPLVVGALVAVNAVGEVVDDDGRVLAGELPGKGEDAGEPGLLGEAPQAGGPSPGANTVIGVVATSARLAKEAAHELAAAAHEGVAAAVRPSHTMWDGDTMFTLATGEVNSLPRRVEQLAERAVAGAIRRAVRLATSVAGVPSVGGDG